MGNGNNVIDVEIPEPEALTALTAFTVLKLK